MGNPLRLVFCFPYRGVGGVSLLFTRLADYLVKSRQFEISIVDYRDGFMATNRGDERVNLIVYDDEVPCQIPEGAILIFQSMTPWSIFPSLSVPPDTKVFFWNCYPYNFVPMLPGAREWMMRQRTPVIRFIMNTLLLRFKLIARTFVKRLYEKHAVAFMDRPNLVATNLFLDLSLDPKEYLPIVVPDAVETVRSRQKTSSLRFAWVGRIVDFKVFSLLRLLEDLGSHLKGSDQEILFDIIGDGDKLSLIESLLPTLPSNLKVELLGSCSPQKLAQYLTDVPDAVFAMGTSALDAARFGIASILLDVSYGTISDSYRYRFLYEVEGFSLGDLLGQTRIGECGRTIENIIHSIQSSGVEHAEKCRSYVAACHSMAVVSSRFIDLVLGSHLTWEDIQRNGDLRQPLSYRLLRQVRGMAGAWKQRVIQKG